MTIFIGSLVLILGFLALRWYESKSENAELRTQIAALKRQLAKRRN